MPDSGYILLGTCFLTPSRIALEVVRTDRRGDTLWISTLLVDTTNVPVKLLPTEDDGAFVLANCWSDNWNDAYMALLRMNSDGTVRWCRKIDASANDLANDMVRSGNELVLLSTTDYNLGTYPGMLLTGLDTAGNLLWSQHHLGNLMTLPGVSPFRMTAHWPSLPAKTVSVPEPPVFTMACCFCFIRMEHFVPVSASEPITTKTGCASLPFRVADGSSAAKPISSTTNGMACSFISMQTEDC